MGNMTFTHRLIERVIADLRLRSVQNEPISVKDVEAASRIPILRDDIIKTFMILEHEGKVTCRSTLRCKCTHDHAWDGPTHDIKLALVQSETGELRCRFCTTRELVGFIDVRVTVNGDWEDEIYREYSEKEKEKKCERADDLIHVILDVIHEKRGR